ncbi:unnamed protein product, partial [Protopolystoma xenopodis]
MTTISRLLVDSIFESRHQTLSLEMEVSSTIMKEAIPRNATFLRKCYHNGGKVGQAIDFISLFDTLQLDAENLAVDYNAGDRFENVPSPLSDAGNHDNYYARRLRTRRVLLSCPDNKAKQPEEKPSCPQPVAGPGQQPIAPLRLHLAPNSLVSEDCMYLNIWVPGDIR